MNGPLAGRLSLGAQSQLLAARFEGEFVDHGDWLVVRNAANPTWYWGNFLLTTAPPLDADLPLWLDRNAQAIGARQPESDHVALWVDAPVAADALPAWRGAGFEFNAVTALQLETGRILAVPLPRIDSMRIRSLRLPEEADAAVDLQALSDHGYEPEGYRRFRAHAMARVSRMHAQGIAHWFGVFAGPQLVADCGLVVDARPGGLARFQDVGTHPEWRRRGACRALVHHVCRFAFETLGTGRLVMCADPDDVAIGIYRSVGFRDAGSHWQLQRRKSGARPQEASEAPP